MPLGPEFVICFFDRLLNGNDFSEDDLTDEGKPLKLSYLPNIRLSKTKLTKIGAFRFTIRGCTGTLITGAILAVASTTANERANRARLLYSRKQV